jgi:Glycosyl hydrolases family 43
MRLAKSDFQFALLYALVGAAIGFFGCSASSSTGASASGGASGLGGASISGGTKGVGGQSASGGSSASGGTSAAGGTTSALGGRTGSGGSSSPLGGATSSGGQLGSGGATGSGGTAAGGRSGQSGQSGQGGGLGTGGANGTGGATGGGGTTGAGGTTDNSCPAGGPANANVTINNTGPWNDTTGKHIQAHGGGLLKVCDTWYWFGEDKTQNTNGTGNFHAISCYASKDLVTWEHRNSVVTTSTDPVLNNVNLIIERPKVLYNASTKMYVLWAHWDMESCSGGGGGYCDSEAIVFTSPTVDGNYKYEKHFQPGGGNTSRDCTLWQEPDGTAYFVSTGGPGGNAGGNFHDTEVYLLSSDYLSVQSTTKIWANDTREAYAFWKANGKYYGVSSAQTGWAPNQAAYLTSTGSITGPWNNSFTGLGPNGSTWSSQPTYVIPIVGSQTTTYIYASDIWNSNNLSLSTYLWLPLKFDGTTWTLTNSAQWSINLATGVVTGN